MRYTAIVLAAGKGSRMKSNVQKQYMSLQGKPVLYYSLKAFEDSYVDHIILVTGEEECSYCKKEIVEKYEFNKVTAIIPGGKERYHSVYRGICAAGECDYLLIHDGARPFLTQDILMRAKKELEQHPAAVAAVMAKDTVKIADDNGFVAETPDRNRVWNVQTPQCFSFPIIKEAYEKLIASEEKCLQKGIRITDDAMVVETFADCRVKLFEGDYRNLKITTPDDMEIAEKYLSGPTQI
ncbi:MAG: 2-C-methyl-D-erythritol 4-phosphate cytidylyltransferase [Lachnospiraceae bacterium]